MTHETPDDLVVQYLAAALEMRESGLEPPLAEICRAHPELIDRVRDALAGVGQLAALDDSARDIDPLAGRVIARRYRIEQRIGAGAMGVVYRGIDVELQRPVAIKILQTSLFGGAEAEARFAREAEVLAALRHPSVITVFDRGTTDDGIMFLVMELLRGEPLGRLLEHFEELPGRGQGVDDTGWLKVALGSEAQIDKSWLRQIVSWAADLAAGLHAAHRAGVLHRDVKPSNVFIDQEGRARLLDFGIASRIAHPTLANRREGGLGTPAYMAPEQIDVAREALPTLDVYGLTATLYHLITLRPPHLGTPSQVIASLQRSDPTPAYKLRRGLPRDLQAIVDCGMARDPRSRYASAADLEGDLRRFLAYQPVRARALSPVGRVWLRAKRSPTARVLAASATVALLSLGAWQWRSALLTKRSEKHASALSRLAPNFGLLAVHGDRVIPSGPQREAVQHLLDEAVDNAEDPLPSRLLRAAFRLDHGDGAGAAADISAIATTYPSAYSIELKHRYATLPVGSSGARALDTTDGPDPLTPVDRVLAAYHILRRSNTADAPDKAAALLDVPELARIPFAVEMSTQTLLSRASSLKPASSTATVQCYQRAQVKAMNLEAMQGRRSAMSAHLLGAALVGQERYEDAEAIQRDGVALAPMAHGLRTNLGITLRRLGRTAEARDHLLAAVQAQPSLIKAHMAIVGTYCDEGNFDAARNHVAGVNFSDNADGERRRNALSGRIEVAHTFAEYRLGHSVVEPIKIALRFLRAAGDASNDLALAEAIATNDVDKIMLAILDILERDPLDAEWLQNLAACMPESTQKGTTQRLSLLFEAQARALLLLRGNTRHHSTFNPSTANK